MPNNATARRGKEKKNKDKKKKDSKKTDTPPLPKEDTASADSGTLSLSSAGQDKAIALPLAGKDVALDLSDPRYLEKAIAARDLEKATAARNLEKALAIWHKEKAKPKAGSSLSLSTKEQEEQQLSLLLWSGWGKLCKSMPQVRQHLSTSGTGKRQIGPGQELLSG